jgi:hypothetical protein
MRTSPYQGLQPFAEPDAPFFFGRDGERTILAANLMAARLTLVYGASGVGKSSVLRAGVLHQLRQQEGQADRDSGAPRLLAVYLNQWSGDPVARLLDRVGQQIARSLGLASPPAAASGGLAGTLAAWTARWHLDLLVILDQFEEYFLYHRDEDGLGSFAAEFPPAVDRPDLPVSFLVAIREDALARLDRFKGHIPNLFENYVRIRHLTASRAEAAILKPLARLNQLAPGQEPWTAEPELVRRVLEGVQVGRVVLAVVGRGQATTAAAGEPPDPPIETPYLQMVLTRLWAQENEQGSRRLRLRTLEALGGPQQIVRTHLDEALDGLPAPQQEVAASIFHYLVTPSGSKIGHSAADLATYTRFSEERVRVVLAALSAPDARIVRPLPAPPGLDEEPRFEIFHDVLAPAILGWRAQWAARRQADAAARRQLEQRARRWRRRQGLAAVLVALLVAGGAGLATRAVLDARTGQAATEAQAAAARQDAGTASAVAVRSNADAYIAQADTICTKGWAAGKVRFPDRPPRQDPEAHARWLNGKVAIGQGTLRQWRDLPVPAAINPKVAPILDDYERGLQTYAVAAALLAAGYTKEAGDVLRRGDQIGQAYQRRARQAGFRECDTALPL